MPKGPRDQKKFDGKFYRLETTRKTKINAQIAAKDLKKEWHSVRITPGNGKWLIYTRGVKSF